MSTQISISPVIKLEVNTTPITGGVVGQVLFQGTGNVLQESANLFWDNTNGTLEATTTADNLFGLRLKSTTGQLRVKPYLNPTYGVLFESKTADGSANLPLTLSGSRLLLADGNVLINTTSDAGYKLDVNGTFRASDSLIASSSGGGAYKLTVQHTGVGQGNTFRVIQLGYSMIDVNTTSVTFMPFPSASGTVGITSWTSTGGQTTTFFAKNSEFTPQGGSQAIPLIKFPNVQSPIVMGATATADLRGYLTVSGSFNATSGLGSGQRLLPTLTAIADNDVLVGLDINPVFTVNTSFVNTSTSLRINANYAPPSWSGNNNQYGIDISPTFRDSNVSIGLRINPNFINISSGGAWALSVENTGYGAIRQTSTATPNIFAGVTSIGANASGNTGFSLNVANAGIKVGTVNSTGQHLVITHSESGATFSSIRSQFSSSSAQMLIDVASQGNLRLFGTGNVAINSGTDAGFKFDVNGTARVKGTGTTSGTTAFTVQSSNGNNSLKVRDDNKVAFGNSSIDCTITGTSGSGNKFEFYAFNGYDVIDGFGNVLVTGLGDTIRLPRNVGIGFNTQNTASAVLQVDSTTRGFLPPRMTNAQMVAIATPATGLMVYDTTNNKLCCYDGTTWQNLF